MPPRRPAILSPAYWHPTAARRGNRLRNGPVSWRPASIPVGRYGRPVRGIPLTGGQGTAIVSAGPSSGPAIVQTATPVAPTAISLPNPTKAGNCVVVIMCIFTNAGVPSVSGVTLGGSADNFASAASATSGDGGVFIWLDPNCAGGQTAIAVSGANLTNPFNSNALFAYEVSGLIGGLSVVDKTSTGTGTTQTSWSSGATATTTVPNEIWFGADANGVGPPVGPAGWTSVSPVIAANQTGAIAGYQVVTSTAAATYSGTQPSDTNWAAAVVTLKGLAPVAAPPAGSATISVGPQGLGNIWYPAQVTVKTDSGVNDTSTCSIYLGAAALPITLLGTIFPGGIGTLGAAVPPLAPGQALIAQWTGGNPGDVAAINVIGTMDSVMPG